MNLLGLLQVVDPSWRVERLLLSLNLVLVQAYNVLFSGFQLHSVDKFLLVRRPDVLDELSVLVLVLHCGPQVFWKLHVWIHPMKGHFILVNLSLLQHIRLACSGISKISCNHNLVSQGVQCSVWVQRLLSAHGLRNLSALLPVCAREAQTGVDVCLSLEELLQSVLLETVLLVDFVQVLSQGRPLPVLALELKAVTVDIKVLVGHAPALILGGAAIDASLTLCLSWCTSCVVQGEHLLEGSRNLLFGTSNTSLPAYGASLESIGRCAAHVRRGVPGLLDRKSVV